MAIKKRKSGGKRKRDDNPSPFENVVFAGGGNRCLWQVGFWGVAAEALRIVPLRVAGVSAGASMACLIFAQRARETLEYFKKLTARNRKNFYFSRLLTGKRAFPHTEMYREGLLFGMDREALKRLHGGPEIRILISRPPGWLGPRSATALGILAYSLEKKFRNPVHPGIPSRLGFRPQVLRADQCGTPEDLADLLIASSCTPPFTPITRWEGKVSLDGGLIDNVPVRILDGEPGRTLVLLTRQYPRESIPRVDGRVYLQPSEPIRITKWDYTNPAGLQEAFDLGRRDGEAFVKEQDQRA